MEKQKPKALFLYLKKLSELCRHSGTFAVCFIFTCLNVSAGSFNTGLQTSNSEMTFTLMQERTITGTVTDERGEPLPGVAITIRGTTIGTVTDVNGVYTITVPATAEYLTFTYVGMQTRNILIGEQLNIDIALAEDRLGLDEVVVIGYGTQTRANVIGSVTSVRSDDLTAAPVSRVSNALAGRLPGGIFMQEGGEPGNDQARILIRGVSTMRGANANERMNNNAPLIVIDGIPGRDMNSLNPGDIESVTVLKDASAAIYGARAANGVILITTKRGQTEAPPSFTYSFYEGFLSPTTLPEMADAATYATMIREMQSYRDVPEANMSFSLEDIEKYKSGEYPWTHPDTDWFAESLRDYSSTRHHNLSVTGGTQNLRYFSSFGTQFDDGIYTNSNTSYNRYNLRANIDVRVNDYINLGLDVTGIQENRSYPTKSAGAIFQGMIRMYPTKHALFPNGLPGPDIEYGDQPMVSASDATGFDDDRRFRSNNLLTAAIRIPGVEGLSLSGYYAYDVQFRQRKLFQQPWVLYDLNEDAYRAAGNTGSEDGSAFLVGTSKAFSEPRVTNYSENHNSQTAHVKLDYTRSFTGGHNLSAFVAYEHREFDAEQFQAFRRYFVSTQLPYLFAGGDAEKDNSGWVELDANQNYFGRLSYDYEGTYLFQFSFRRDGSLRFSKDAGRWGNFPSVLLGWRPSEYDWWKNSVGFINYFKLRASYGQMGNDLVDAFQYLTSYGFNQGYTLGTGKLYQAGLDQANVPNPNITWERSTVYNAGWESMFLNSRLSWETDFFYERRTDILIRRDVSVPRFTGIALPDENFGIVENRGIETTLGFRDRRGDFGYHFSGNFAFARNKVVEADEPERSVSWQQQTGLPMGAHLLFEAIGIFRDWDHVNSLPHVPGARPGDVILRDYDGDGQITTDDRYLFPLTTIPEMTFGFSFDFTYRNWGLRGLLQGHSRAMRYIYTDRRIGTAGNYFQFDADDRWTPDNTVATRGRAYEREEEYWRNNSHMSDYMYADVSYVRLRNLQLSYSIPQSLRSRIGSSDLSLYVAGQNLLLLYSGNDIFDPEVAGMGSYPIMRTISLGAKVTF